MDEYLVLFGRFVVSLPFDGIPIMLESSKSFRYRAENLGVMADHPETDFRLMNLLLSTAEELEQYADEIEHDPPPAAGTSRPRI